MRWEVWFMVLLPGVPDGGAGCGVEYADVGLLSKHQCWSRRQLSRDLHRPVN
ncbi:hypothetical protein BC827DRAFT_1234249 [Russula dissimulans]|nr:hypothetical protein BC827DRAFT_1234249 [Russula dissimulans]